jgi:predicted nuclease with TOPRIM domain
MATNTEKIDKLSIDLNNLNTRVEREFGLFAQTDNNHENKLKELENQREKLLERCHELEVKNASLEERLKLLDKGTDRRWQFVMMLVSAAISATVAFSVASIKKP